MNMIEKVARGMYNASYPENKDWPVTHLYERYIKLSKAAIQAMREPTYDMIDEYFKIRRLTGDDKIDSCFNISRWESSINAALKESAKDNK